MGLSWPLFVFIFPFSWRIVRLRLIIFTMVNDDRKQEDEGKVCTILFHAIRKSPTPSENRLTAILTWKKAKSVPGFEPSLTFDLQKICERSISFPVESSSLWQVLNFHLMANHFFRLIEFRVQLDFAFKTFAWKYYWATRKILCHLYIGRGLVWRLAAVKNKLVRWEQKIS